MTVQTIRVLTILILAVLLINWVSALQCHSCLSKTNITSSDLVDCELGNVGSFQCLIGSCIAMGYKVNGELHSERSCNTNRNICGYLRNRYHDKNVLLCEQCHSDNCNNMTIHKV